MATEPLCLLSVHAHPDDESSKGAGTVALLSDTGVRCVLVCCTGGEVGDILNPAMDTEEVRADIAGVRRKELHQAAEIPPIVTFRPSASETLPATNRRTGAIPRASGAATTSATSTTRSATMRRSQRRRARGGVGVDVEVRLSAMELRIGSVRSLGGANSRGPTRGGPRDA